MINILETDMQCVPMFCEMQKNGVAINPDEFRELDKEFTGKMEELQAEINQLAGRTLNPGSSEQVEQYLYKELGLHKHSPIVKHTKASGQDGNPERFTTSSDVLKSIIEKHPIVAPIVRWREYQKLVTTYIRVLPRIMHSDGRVRSRALRITRTTTGRPSMSEPNLLAQPTRSEDAKRMRRGFIAPPGKLLLEIDYSQIEMRMAAHCSMDPAMIDVFYRGGDLHSETASRMFGLPLDKLDKMKHRYPAKTAGFGVLYMISGDGLLRQFIEAGAKGWDKEKCEALIKSWYEVHRGVREWQEEVKAEARRYGRVEDIWGRVRLIPEVVSAHKEIREAGIRQAVNAPIQMGAGGVMKRAMAKLWPMIEEMGVEEVMPLLQIYDSLVFEVREGMEWVGGMFKEVMEGVCELSVPVVAKGEMGENWGSMEEIK